MSTPIDALRDQIDAANAEIKRIKRICHELYLEDIPMCSNCKYFGIDNCGMYAGSSAVDCNEYAVEIEYYTRVEIAMREVLGLSNSAAPSDRQGDHSGFSDKDIPF